MPCSTSVRLRSRTMKRLIFWNKANCCSVRCRRTSSSLLFDIPPLLYRGGQAAAGRCYRAALDHLQSNVNMTESEGERGLIAWSVPQCPFTIEVTARVLDDIRLAVVDAFFSLPRGGAEIGGVLLGKFAGDRLTISDHAALDCEHAHGPRFTLSAPDEGRLTEMLSLHSLNR